MAPMSTPVLEVEPGAVVTVETHDAFEGKIKAETDKPSEILNFPFLNPQTGPDRVKGAERATAWPCASCRSSRAARSPSAPPA
jgi:amidase